MAIGYTHRIGNGASFEEFALGCARGFGALISLRDTDNAPIPETFEASDYHKGQLALATVRAEAFEGLSDDDLHKDWDAEHDHGVLWRSEANEKRNKLKNAYQSMLEEITGWTPPTNDHVDLKAFMLSQVERSIEFDCSHHYETPVKQDFHSWKTEKSYRLWKACENHKDGYQKDVDRAERNTKWIKALRDSL